MNTEIKDYYKILSSNFPEFINKYIQAPELQRLSGVGQFCGVDYTSLPFYNLKYFYSRLDHSIAVALIIWNFTKDKKQTLAGLFHDISTPIFSHVIDYMHGDTLKQELTEENTENIIKNSTTITELLNKDNIDINDVINYKMYPIADNERPKLSADRLEGLFSAKLIWLKSWNLNDIKEIYDNITILKNEDNINELGFKNQNIAQKFTEGMLDLAYSFQDNNDKLTLNFLGDILKSSLKSNIIQEQDLFTLTEQQVIKKIKYSNCEITKNAWNFFENMQEVKSSNQFINNKYCISLDCKRRYIDTLVMDGNLSNRISNISEDINEKIEKFKNYNDLKYAYIDFNFNN